MRNLLFWGLFPFVLPQAVHVRRTAPRFAAAAGATEGSYGTGETLRLVGIGDSIIAGVGARDHANALVAQAARRLSQALGNRVAWSAIGSIGANSGKVLGLLVPRLPRERADVFVVSVGVNDVTSLSGVGRWTRNLEDLLAALRRHSPEAVLAVAGIPPLRGFPLLPQPLRALFGVRGETFDAVIRRVVARHPGAVYVPLDFDPLPEKFSADGFHPSEDSYREFAGMVVDRVADAVRDGRAGPHPC